MSVDMLLFERSREPRSQLTTLDFQIIMKTRQRSSVGRAAVS